MQHEINVGLKEGFAADVSMFVESHAPDRRHNGRSHEHEGEAGSRALPHLTTSDASFDDPLQEGTTF
jgi:hypothetical protein